MYVYNVVVELWFWLHHNALKKLFPLFLNTDVIFETLTLVWFSLYQNVTQRGWLISQKS